MKLSASLRRLFRDVADLLLPRRCVVCGQRLAASEQTLCTACQFQLPYTRWRGRLGNPVERLFWARLPIERANAFLRYESGAESSRLVHALKYGNRPDVGRHFGRQMAADLSATDFFDGIDGIVPVPLAARRQRRRGYNQSEQLAAGIAAVTHLPLLTDVVERVKDNPTQTSLSAMQRQENVAGIFRLVCPEAVHGKHLLLVDDVLTTGATLLSCARELVTAGSVRLSILTLCVAGRHGEGVDPTEPPPDK